MVSFKLRRVFYSAAASAEEVLSKKRQTLAKIEEIENQLVLAKKLMNKIEKEEDYDAASLIRMEGKIKKLEVKIKQRKQAVYG
ncbi:MAG: hypothetical protein ACP5N2_03560 [Candidatus Nanoarchaeia archaeon]